MLYLITGANGAGKTLNTLKWVRERSVKEGRPVCHNGRFEPVEGGELSSWKSIDMKDWQNEPDGTIFLVDECHNDFPLRAPSSAPPDYVKMLAEHRRRGFDFYLVTQHPQNIDSFVRRLIGSPGWHRHLKRTFGADLVSCIEWSAVNPNCEKDGSGKTGTVTMVAFPKEVYGWYRSASLHTGKKKIPRAVWMLGAVAVLVPTFGYFAVTGVYGNVTKRAKPAEVVPAVATAANGPTEPVSAVSGRLTVDGYLDQRKPRITDFPHTAPVYDDVTKPAVAPYPAACVHMGKTCKCYSQQGTLLIVSGEVCIQIVNNGYFVDWENPRREAARNPQLVEHRVRDVEAQRPRVVNEVESKQPVNQWASALALRNSQVRSNMDR
ncbi:MAG: hypothetical protein JSS06_00155 [Proteobacteria bacterium]|nr:hypothetical protein [Pseudomonadota bacterium]